MTALADIVLVLHAALATFIVGGFVAIWIGAMRGWAWVRERRFRFVHLTAIAIVALLAALDIPCPSTTLEDWLRTGRAGPQGFLQYWLGRLLYYELPTWVFTVAYVLFALAVLLTWRYVPPRSKPRR
ncbi:DUF2784 domain-containing protein [Trinickia dabaoshanensis]|uniref:DUF2784 domain-containing protein n=1 Tax=Trinickia dabaoshanensis TaxID=564714 RepID=A0A2N7VZN4_9BURK|nr:DUF2784 domain-containing protein [Trinickia dabaoshanensis]PMS22600.1 DUF2784 domain-containing protein [Trinickia dabaoshanensis]